MQRRNFLKYAGLGAGFSLGKIPVYASSAMDLSTVPDDTVLVVIQMFGGNDALNTVIPADNDLYYNKYRKTLHIPKTKAIKLGNTNTYLHPALARGEKQGFKGLWDSGKLAIIQGVGYPNPNLSHFRSTDIWLSGQNPVSDAQRLESGWLARYFDGGGKVADTSHPACINIGNSSSLLFQAENQNIGLSLNDPKAFYESGRDILSGEPMATDGSDYSGERNFLLNLASKSNIYSTVVKRAFDNGVNYGTYPDDTKNKLSGELKLISRLIGGGLKTKVYLASIDGFDTHAYQGTTDGKHNSLLGQISEAVDSFMTDLKLQNISKKVVGMTVSEFGRRPNQNESYGCDHGAAGAMFVFGDAVNGNIYGNNFGFDKLDKNQDFIHTIDYRSVYDEILSKWFGSDNSTVNGILGKRYDQVGKGLFSKASYVVLGNEPTFKTSIGPNPTVNGWVELTVKTTANEKLTINQTDISGRTVELLPGLTLPAGVHKIPVQLMGQKGMYMLSVKQKSGTFSSKIIYR
jgi:uncharacterized protein (DUF1501 family)